MNAHMKKTRFITYTSVLIALLVALQFFTKSFGQLVTGSCVNLILAVAVFCCGLPSGLTVALISPCCAFLLGIGPAFIQLVPFIALGNAVYVLLLNVKKGTKPADRFLWVAVAAAGKFAVMSLIAAKLVVPALGLPEAKAAVVSAGFTWPQLFTALTGGILAVEIVPMLKKTIGR